MGKGYKAEHRSPDGPRVIAIEVDKVKVDDDDVSDAIGEAIATTLGARCAPPSSRSAASGTTW